MCSLRASVRSVTVDWDDWAAFHGAPGRPLDEVPRAVAVRYFEDLMAARPARVEALTRLLRHNGVRVGRR